MDSEPHLYIVYVAKQGRLTNNNQSEEVKSQAIRKKRL